MARRSLLKLQCSQECELKNLEMEPPRFRFLVHHHPTKRQEKSVKLLESRCTCGILFNNFSETVRMKKGRQLHTLTAGFGSTDVLCLCNENVKCRERKFFLSFFSSPGIVWVYIIRCWWFVQEFPFVHLNVFFCAVCPSCKSSHIQS